MKRVKFMVMVGIVASLLSCEKEDFLQSEYRVEIISTTSGKLVAESPRSSSMRIGKGKTIICYGKKVTQSVAFIFHLDKKCKAGEVKMTLHAGDKTTSITNEDSSELIGIEGDY